MGVSIGWLLKFIDAFIDGDSKEETDEYDCAETTWGVFKAYAFFIIPLVTQYSPSYRTGKINIELVDFSIFLS